ncbi:MAG: putative membrane protein YkgB, partial [Reinekea sp.]
MPQTLKSPLPIAKPSLPYKSPLLLLVSVGFCAGLFLMAGVWLFSAKLGLASSILTMMMLLISLVFLLIALRVYAHIT